MTNEGILLIVLIVVVLAAVPAWPYSSSWGYGPISALGLLLIVFLVWALYTQRPFFRSTAEDLRATVQDAGHDLREAGRNAADTIRNAVQQ